MKDKIFVLSSCSTCTRIMSETGITSSMNIQNVKEKNISESELDELAKLSGSYESLFNKRAMKYKNQGLNKIDHSEQEWRKLILGEYTFLKRPLVILDGELFAGNAKSTVALLKEKMDERAK